MITTALEGLQERRLGSCGKPLICHSGDFPELVRPRKDFLFKDQEKCLNARLAAVIVKPPRELRGATPGPRASRFGVRFQFISCIEISYDLWEPSSRGLAPEV